MTVSLFVCEEDKSVCLSNKQKKTNIINDDDGNYDDDQNIDFPTCHPLSTQDCIYCATALKLVNRSKIIKTEILA